MLNYIISTQTSVLGLSSIHIYTISIYGEFHQICGINVMISIVVPSLFLTRILKFELWPNKRHAIYKRLISTSYKNTQLSFAFEL